ncbi:hypothetical protein, partial [Azonexus fungiphilus]|uniref:hypothetical protein n=1 Tax=Azonexus fungiphilus TaxID=146940 RepID=UPI001B8710F5
RRAVSFDSSAAEKRDYVPLTHFRQALQQNFFHLTACLTPPETPSLQGRCAFYTHHKTRQLHFENF